MFSLFLNFENEFNPTELVVLFFITFVALFVFANTGLGPGIIIQIGYWSMASIGLVNEAKLSTVLVYLSFSKYPMGMIQSIIKRKYILFQFKYAVVLIITVFISTFIGIFILVRYQSPLLVRCLGCLLLISLIITFFKEYFINQKEENIETEYTDRHKRYNIEKDIKYYALNSFQKYFGLIITSILSGFSRGLYGVGGPPFMIYQLITNFDRRSFSSLMAFADGFGSGLMTMIYLLFIEKKFQNNQWFTYLIIFIAASCGLIVGNKLSVYVDQHTFKIGMQLLLFCGSINLILVNLNKISIYASTGLAIIFVIIAIGLTIRLYRIHNHRKDFTQIVDK